MTLQELRGRYGLSLEDIARITGVARTTVERIDTGKPVKPDEAMKVRLSLTLALSIPLPSSVLHIALIEADTRREKI